MNKPEKLILDYSKWRCGEGGAYPVGNGKTQLLNNEGFMCCLGMWSLQCGAQIDELLNKGEPNELKTLIPLFAEEETWEFEEINPETGEFEKYTGSDGKSTSRLASLAIGINDEKETTPEHKIELLKELLSTEGIQLEVINKP